MIIIEVIYSILCAVLPCTIYFTARKRKGYHLSILAMLIFVLYLWKVYDLTGAGGLTNIFYAPKGGDNTSIIQANINLIPFNIIENFLLKYFNACSFWIFSSFYLEELS